MTNRLFKPFHHRSGLWLWLCAGLLAASHWTASAQSNAINPAPPASRTVVEGSGIVENVRLSMMGLQLWPLLVRTTRPMPAADW